VTASAAPPVRSLRVAAACCTLLVLLLPTLMSLRAISAPAAPGELARLERVVAGVASGAQAETGGARLFLRAAVAGERWPSDGAEQYTILVRARVAQVLGVTALALLTYLAVMMASGRFRAALACVLFALLPPVAGAGWVIRADTFGALFALCSVVLMQVASLSAPRERARQPGRAALVSGGLLLCAAVAIAVACDALPSLDESLLVPVVVLSIAAAQLALRGRRVLSRRGFVRVPIQAINRRLIPWTALGFLTPVVALVVLTRSNTAPMDALAALAPQSSLLPEQMFGWLAFSALFALGGLVLIVQIGLRLSRGGRISPALILFAYCAVSLLASFSDGVARDPLPLVPAAAAVGSAGIQALLAPLRPVFRRR